MNRVMRSVLSLMLAVSAMAGLSVAGASVASAATAPDNVTNLVVSDVSYRSFTLSWTPPANDGGSPLTQYQMWVNGNFAIGIPASQTSYTYTGMNPDTSYRVEVRAVNTIGGAPLPLTEITTRTLPLTVPDSPFVNLEVIGNTTFQIFYGASGTDGGSPLTEYIVSINGSEISEQPYPTNRSSFGVYTPGEVLNVSVYSVNFLGRSAPNSFTVRVGDRSVPAAPAPLVFPADGEISLVWNAPFDGYEDLTGYTIAIDGVETVLPSSATSFSFANLVPGQSYSLSLFASNALGDGPAWSANVVASYVAPAPVPVPDAPVVAGPAPMYLSVLPIDGLCPSGWSMGGWEEWAGQPVCFLMSSYDAGSRSWPQGTYAEVLQRLEEWRRGPVVDGRTVSVR